MKKLIILSFLFLSGCKLFSPSAPSYVEPSVAYGLTCPAYMVPRNQGFGNFGCECRKMDKNNPLICDVSVVK